MTTSEPDSGSKPDELESEKGPDKVTFAISKRALITGSCGVLIVAVAVIAFLVGHSTSTNSQNGLNKASTIDHSTTSTVQVATTTILPPTTTSPPASTTTTAPPPSPINAFQILAPAMIPPVSAECSEQLSFGADGTAAPLTCPKGGVNVLAWSWYARYGNEITQLTPDTTPSDVYTTACDDTSNGVSYPEEGDLYALAAAYYGWQFAYNPTVNLQSCSGQP
jgi:hypothetical protein